jgi:hypothetical protein
MAPRRSISALTVLAALARMGRGTAPSYPSRRCHASCWLWDAGLRIADQMLQTWRAKKRGQGAQASDSRFTVTVTVTVTVVRHGMALRVRDKGN